MSAGHALRLQVALASRLRAAAACLHVAVPAAEHTDPARDAGALLSTLGLSVAGLAGADRAAALWLMHVAVSARFPDSDEMRALQRAADLCAPREVGGCILDHASSKGLARDAALEMRIIEDGVLVDVDFAARNDHNTGIQRVIRRTVPHWAAVSAPALVAWTTAPGAYRSLTAAEADRVLRWGEPPLVDAVDEPPALIVPWRSQVVLSEVPSAVNLDPLAAIAQFSGSRVSAIGYDVIPITSRDSVSRTEANRFARYLAVVKHMSSVVAISQSAADEFSGFASMLPAQGLTGPRVTAVLLPADPARSDVLPEPGQRPLVVSVGSKEPRKNQIAVLVAAERLWREGLDFELLYIGSYGYRSGEFSRWLRRLEKLGRPVRAPHRVGDAELRGAYASARFTVFPSLHEGFGLPVAESLRYGTPVITTRYGSTAEIAVGGGCLLVDPRDDDDILAAMRLLLSDDGVVDRLRAEAAARDDADWPDFAERAWEGLVLS